jgi:hypothetical protein
MVIDAFFVCLLSNDWYGAVKKFVAGSELSGGVVLANSRGLNCVLLLIIGFSEIHPDASIERCRPAQV